MPLLYLALAISLLSSAQGVNQSLKDKASERHWSSCERHRSSKDWPVPSALGGRILRWVGLNPLQHHQQVVMGGRQQLLPRRRKGQTSWDLEFTPDGFYQEWAGFDLRLWLVYYSLVDIWNWPGHRGGRCSFLLTMQCFNDAMFSNS